MIEQLERRKRFVLVDVEASGNTPYSGVMTEFGIVDPQTLAWFHGHLWDYTPDPIIPAIPVPTVANPGWTATLPAGGGHTFNGERIPAPDAATVFAALDGWFLNLVTDRRADKIVMFSDNPAYDFMWMADGFDRADIDNPLGHTARRIGDLAAGLSGRWLKTSEWKRHRKTGHDHNPVNDSLGNAEALVAILALYEQAWPGA